MGSSSSSRAIRGRKQNAVSKYPAAVSNQSQRAAEIRRDESHSASDWYREGCSVGGRGINLGHTYSLPQGVARTDRLGGERRRHRSAVASEPPELGLSKLASRCGGVSYGQSGHPDCARPGPKMTQSSHQAAAISARNSRRGAAL
jgi:hypothetical protein